MPPTQRKERENPGFDPFRGRGGGGDCLEECLPKKAMKKRSAPGSKKSQKNRISDRPSSVSLHWLELESGRIDDGERERERERENSHRYEWQGDYDCNGNISQK
jgi:hypothetical protein